MIAAELNQRALWAKALKTEPFRTEPADTHVIGLLQKYFTKYGPAKIVDIGCGNGRHVEAAALLGHSVVGVDFAWEAIYSCNPIAHDNPSSVRLVQASMKSLPFCDETFDIALSWCVVNHGTVDDFHIALSESMRVVKTNGVTVGMVISRSDPRYGLGVPIAPHTFEFEEGAEKGILHYFAARNELRKLLDGLGVVEVLEEIEFAQTECIGFYDGLVHSAHCMYVVRKAPSREI